MIPTESNPYDVITGKPGEKRPRSGERERCKRVRSIEGAPKGPEVAPKAAEEAQPAQAKTTINKDYSDPQAAQQEGVSGPAHEGAGQKRVCPEGKDDTESVDEAPRKGDLDGLSLAATDKWDAPHARELRRQASPSNFLWRLSQRQCTSIY